MEKITVKQIFNLIDSNGEGTRKVQIRPECEEETWFTVPSRYDYLAEAIQNSYVDSLEAEDDQVCIWLESGWDKKDGVIVV